VVAPFRQVTVVDYEFWHAPTGKPVVVCVTGWELYSGRRFSLLEEELGPVPPYGIGPDDVVVFYSGQEAELPCHLTRGWDLPWHCVDLMPEYRMAINGLGGEKQLKMLDACERLGVPILTSPVEKDRARARILQGPPFSAAENAWFVSYCMTDTEEEMGVLQALPEALSPHALWRGQFIKAISRMWWRGVPIDPRYTALATDPVARLTLKTALVDDLRRDFPVYEGTTLKNELLEKFLDDHGIPIPRTPTGRVSKADEELVALARDHSLLAPLVESLKAQNQLHDFSLPIGSDYRLRAWFGPFLTKTSRAGPPTNGYIYSLPAWMRATMQPEPGYALAYCDWDAMEFGLAASQSHCPNMVQFYESGDPYIAAAKTVGAVPPGATKTSHRIERELYKIGMLACQYGIGAERLAARLGRSVSFARRFIDMHHYLFPTYWRWSDAVVAAAILSGEFRSRHGWKYAVREPFRIPSLRNWTIQTLGADILRLACILADAQGIEMLATAHDAVLIQALEDEIEAAAATMASCMERAAMILTDGFRLRASIDIRRHGERFVDPRGQRTLAIVDRFLGIGERA
jgi:hypothetical protein